MTSYSSASDEQQLLYYYIPLVLLQQLITSRTMASDGNCIDKTMTCGLSRPAEHSQLPAHGIAAMMMRF